MRGVILQPGYIPWLGFFNQMFLSDLFIYLDDVQFDRRGWRNRNQIRGPHGAVWLTIPIVQKGRYNQILKETKIDNSSNWQTKHLRSLKHFYSRTRYFVSLYPQIERILKKEWKFLLDLDVQIINQINQFMGLNVQTEFASHFHISNHDKTGRLVEICHKSGINDYISGPLCEDYMDYDQLKAFGINLYLHEYVHPEYPQRFTPFIPFLSIVDLLFNTGRHGLEILKNSQCLKKFQGN